MDITREEWAYLAGVMDADGCIRIRGEKRKRAPSSLAVIVTNGDASLVIWLRDRFGGKPYSRGTQRCWNIWWTAKKAVYILEGIYPFLIVKQKQAELALAFQDLLGSRHRGGSKPRLTEGDIAKREALIEAVSILKNQNKVGGQLSWQ